MGARTEVGEGKDAQVLIHGKVAMVQASADRMQTWGQQDKGAMGISGIEME